MKNTITTFLIALVLISCKKDFSPIATDISIYHTGQSENDRYEFRVSNNSAESVWYRGYESKYPIYQYSIWRSDGWEGSGPGWCGTGLCVIEFPPGDAFFVEITKPQVDQPWRAGLQILYNEDEEGEMIWSQRID